MRLLPSFPISGLTGRSPREDLVGADQSLLSPLRFPVRAVGKKFLFDSTASFSPSCVVPGRRDTFRTQSGVVRRLWKARMTIRKAFQRELLCEVQPEIAPLTAVI